MALDRSGYAAAVLGVAIVFHSGGCAENPAQPVPGVATLTWEGFDGRVMNDPDNATYVLNGAVVGRGKDGFLKVLAAVSQMPISSERIIGWAAPWTRKGV